MAALGCFTSAFTQTGSNMSAGANARREAQELLRSAPWWARQIRPAFIVHHRLRRLFGGMYLQKPFSYQIFTRQSQDRRQLLQVRRPRFRAQVQRAPSLNPQPDRQRAL